MPSSCVGFDSLAANTSYAPGDIIVDGPVTLYVQSFVSPSGIFSNYARVRPSARAGGSGQEIEVNNVLLELQLNDALRGITLRFGEYGGSVNLSVNGVLFVVRNFDILNGTILGIQFSAVGPGASGQGTGDLKLRARRPNAIKQFSIGGQELFIDDLCLIS
jgi:hypothetical protein